MKRISLVHLILLITWVYAEILAAMNAASEGQPGPVVIDLRGENLEDEILDLRQGLEEALVESREDDAGVVRYRRVTFELKTPRDLSNYSLYIPRIRSAYQLSMDGKIIAKSGKVATKVSDEVPEISVIWQPLAKASNSARFELIISSFNTSLFEALPHIQLASHSLISEKRVIGTSLDTFMIGAMIIMAGYHFVLFFLRPQNKSPLWFGLLCSIIAVRASIYSQFSLSDQLALPLNFDWLHRFEYLTFTLGTVATIVFIKLLYPLEVSDKWLKYPVIGISLGYSLLILTTPVASFSKFLIYYQMFFLVFAITTVGSVSLAIMRKRDGAIIFMAGFVILFLAAVNDTLTAIGIIESPITIHFAQVAFIFSQASLLSIRFTRAFIQLEIAEKEITDLNKGLEAKVIERTKTIRTILDNVKAGFFLVDKDLKIQEGYTKSCQEILDRTIRTGDYLLEAAPLDERLADTLKLALKQVFNDFMPEEVSLKQIPPRIKLGQKTIAVQAALVRDENNLPVSVLFTIYDASELVEAEREVAQNRSLLQILQDKDSYSDFVRNTLGELNEIVASDASRETIAMLLHTLKGNFAAFGVEDISDFIHEMEETLEPTREDLKNLIELIERKNKDILEALQMEETESSFQTFQVETSHLENLETAIRDNNLSKQFILDWLSQAQSQSWSKVIGPMSRNAKQLAKDLGKDLKVEILGGEKRINSKLHKKVLQQLVHLVRNSVDHGIEYSENRGNKPETASLKLELKEADNSITIIVEDDGCGIDVEKIKSIARQKHLLTQQDLESSKPEDVIDLIFHPGFSTQEDKESKLSGRGYGMSALKHAVEQAGGEIKTSSKVGFGVRFEIHLPNPAKDSQISKRSA